MITKSLKKKVYYKGNKYTVLISKQDEKLFNSHRWQLNLGKYLITTKLGLFHRIVTNCPKNKIVDHINNNNTFDNRRENLQITNYTLNNRKSQKHKKKTSIYKGVYYNKLNRNWRAQIVINWKAKHLGCFKNEKDAAIAYNKAALKFFKKAALLNET